MDDPAATMAHATAYHEARHVVVARVFSNLVRVWIDPPEGRGGTDISLPQI